jgi:hypothetical protein
MISWHSRNMEHGMGHCHSSHFLKLLFLFTALVRIFKTMSFCLSCRTWSHDYIFRISWRLSCLLHASSFCQTFGWTACERVIWNPVYPVLSPVSPPEPSHKVKRVPFQALQKYGIWHISHVELYSVTNMSTYPGIRNLAFLSVCNPMLITHMVQNAEQYRKILCIQ